MDHMLDGVHVLLVDEDEVARRTAQRALEYRGAFVLGVDSANAALALLRRVRPDVLVYDIRVGVWLLDHARSAGYLAGVPVIALAARATAPDPGIDAVIELPFTPTALCERVGAMARRRSRHAA